MSPIPVYVLVGGASRRFGADKASHLVEGEPWALNVGRRLARPGGEVVLVGATSLEGARRIDDAGGVEGPVAGVLAAVRDRLVTWGPGRLVIASCDLVRPEAPWLAALGQALDRGGQTIAAYRDAEQWHPLPLVVDTAALPAAEHYATAGGRSLHGLLSTAGAAAVQWRGAVGGPPQANTLDELERAFRDAH